MSSASAGIGSALPYQGDSNGLYLTTDGTVASWASVSGAGVTTMTAVGSSPNANGATISGNNLTLQPADATHPGLVSTATQTLAGAKTFSTSVQSPTFIMDEGSGPIIQAIQSGSAYGLWMYPGSTTPSAGNYTLIKNNDNNTYLNCETSGAVYLLSAGATMVFVNATTIDGTGLGAGGAIKLKSPDGTTYTAHIANGGTWSIA